MIQPARSSSSKSIKAKMKTKRTRAEAIAEMERESEEIERLYKQGKLKAYSSAEEMHKDIFNEV